MFGVKQVQTVDVAAMVDRIMENHDSKVLLDKLKAYLDSIIHKRTAGLNDDAEIRKNAENGYSWYYEPLESMTISVKEFATIIGYEVPAEDSQIVYECNKKYKQYYAESHKKEEE